MSQEKPIHFWIGFSVFIDLAIFFSTSEKIGRVGILSIRVKVHLKIFSLFILQEHNLGQNNLFVY